MVHSKSLIAMYALATILIQAASGLPADWTTYTTAEGLAHDAVGAIALTPNAELWCAYAISEASLSRFDGESWSHHTTEQGLPACAILWTGPIVVAPDGALWVGTFGAGIARFDGKMWTTYTAKDGLLNDAISTLMVAPDGDLWCGHAVENGGISRFDGKNWTTYPASRTGGVGEYPILSMAADRDGVLWVGSGGVSRYDGENWTHYKTELGMDIPVATALAVGKDGELWVGGGGITRYDGESWTHYSCAEMGLKDADDCGVGALAIDMNGALWIGVGKWGVICYDGENWTRYTKEDGLAGNSVLSIKLAADGSLWFGTEQGLSHYQPSTEEGQLE
jgi:ligand-binding sensor domain-containing protein